MLQKKEMATAGSRSVTEEGNFKTSEGRGATEEREDGNRK